MIIKCHIIYKKARQVKRSARLRTHAIMRTSLFGGMTLNIWLTLAICLSLVACSEKADEKPSEAETIANGNTFSNAKFAMSIEKPENWHALSTNELLTAFHINDDENQTSAILALAMKHSLPLFMFTKYPPGTRQAGNSSITGVAEYLGQHAEATNGCGYLEKMKDTPKQAELSLEFKGDCVERAINGNPFKYTEATIRTKDIALNQRYFACRHDKHMITLVMTYEDSTENDNETELMHILDKLQLACDQT